MLFQEICASWRKLNEGWPLTKDLSTLLRLLKLLKLKNNYITALWLLKFLIMKKELHHFLMTIKVFNTEKGHHCCFKVFNTKKGLHHFLRIVTVFVIEKGLRHFFETLKGLNIEKWLHHILMTLKVFQNSYSAEHRMLVNSRFWRFLITSHLWLTNFTCSVCPVS